jgi:Fic family protein
MMENRFNRRIKANQEILTKISQIDQFKGFWQGGVNLSPQILGRIKSWVIITSAGASTRIEGSRMTDEEIARFLRGFNAKNPKNRDEQEVAGYADLMARIFDNYKTIKLSENWILQFHEILLHFSEKDRTHKGKYKMADNAVAMINEKGERVILFEPTPPYLVKPEMQAIIEWTNEQLESGKVHPVLIIANFIFEFLAIHPFEDGNGRISRALTNLLLLREGYSYVPYVSLDEIIEETKADYYLALRATQKKHKTNDEDVTPWTNYFLLILVEQAKRARKLMESRDPENLLSGRQSQVYSLFKGSSELGVAEIDNILKGKIPKATIKQALSRLVKLKLLERMGQARSTRYRKIIKN